MQLPRAIHTRVRPQPHGGRSTDRADRLEPCETCPEAVPDFELALSKQRPQCGLEVLEDHGCAPRDGVEDGRRAAEVITCDGLLGRVVRALLRRLLRDSC